jgi:hypothetical protein
VAILTVAPLATMRARVDRKEVGGVIKGGSGPGRDSVAGFALRTEPGTRVCRIRSAIVISLMAGKTSTVDGGELSRSMTLHAIETGVPALQWKEVVSSGEASARPAHHIVALRAVGSKTGIHVIGRAGGGVVPSMASEALAVGVHELNARSRGLVTLIAVEGRVSAAQWKASLAVHRDLMAPIDEGPCSVAGRTIDAELSLVNILVTVRAVRTHPLELERIVTEEAFGTGVGSLESEAVAIMIEALRDHRLLPTLGDVAGLAGLVKLAVRGLNLRDRPVRGLSRDWVRRRK